MTSFLDENTENSNLIKESIIRDISEGVLAISFDGIIIHVNNSACDILNMASFDMLGHRFAECFFTYEENDSFNQTVMDAVYDKENSHEAFVDYYDGFLKKQLHINTSFLKNGEERIGVIASFRDITELSELRDAVRAMEKIKALNSQLELRNKLLSTTFGRYLSDEIVRELLDTPDGLALGGKKRDVTVMMSDLRGFTALSERMDAGDLVTMLNHYFGIMNTVIEKYHGTIIEFLGDGIFVVFGAPTQRANHAELAVASAIEMQARMKEVNDWNRENGYPDLEMGIGINSGSTIIGNIGSTSRTKYGVMGSNVNLAGRIESYTTGGQVLISPSTRAAIKAPLTVETESRVFPKGTDIPITISQVSALGEPYNVSCNIVTEPPAPLPQAVNVDFLVISGKHVDTVYKKGSIIAISGTDATFATDLSLEVFDNIQIEAQGKLFSKVIGIEDGFVSLRFTSTPPGFDSWLSDIKKGLQ